MKFEAPYLLFLLLPLFLLWRRRVSRPAASVEKNRLPLLIFSIACLILGLAKPYWSTTPQKKVVKGADFIILLDVSQSMFCPEPRGGRRIDEAKNLLHELLPQFTGSSVAVIYFAGDAVIGCPLTDDARAVQLFLDSVTPGMTRKPGSDPDSLKNTLQNFLEDLHSSSVHSPKKEIALLFTDGEFTQPANGLAEWVQSQKNLSLFTFACGKGKAPVPNFELTAAYPGAFSEADPTKLRTLFPGPFYALAAGAPVISAGDATNQVRDILTEGREVPLFQFVPFLILSFGFLLAYQIYPVLSRVHIPARAAASMAAVLLLMTTLSMSKQEKSTLFQEALRDFKQKKDSEALEKLQRLLKEGAPEEVDIAIGNIYLAEQKYDQAIEIYEKVLRENPMNSQARWNWEVALKRQQKPHNNPPPKPPQQRPSPQEMPKETQALLKYFDQQEKQQMQLTNSINAHTEQFAW